MSIPAACRYYRVRNITCRKYKIIDRTRTDLKSGDWRYDSCISYRDPVEEIKSAKLILKTLGLRKGGIEVVSCPTCGRTKIDLIGLANQVQDMVADIPLDIKVAVMGCVVNGPGEAKEADIGIAGGCGEGLLIKKGEIVKKVKEEELLETLRQELLHWNE